ncbi:MAG: DNA polymerase [Ignavibacteria bacterium]|nr:DNA polymerase [Ignavibacteria bacterium]
MNPLLFGGNSDERIVAVHHQADGTMRVCFRVSPSEVTHDDTPFYPFFFLGNRAYLDGFPKEHWVRRLTGDGYFNHLCVFGGWTTMWEAIRYVMDHYNREQLKKIDHYTQLDCLHLYTDPVTQYLLQTGRTLFKGMRFEDLHRMQLDIETYSTGQYRFSNAGRETDRIILIAVSDNRGWHHLINGKELDEPEMLHTLARIITERDPDVLEGHNILAFDLPYILKRCALHNIGFPVGRDGSTPRGINGRPPGEERIITEVAGRHIVDTLLLVQNYDAVKRNMESYGLKYAARYFDVSAQDRIYIPGDKISWHWDHDADPLLKYALDDVHETRALSDILSGTSFYLTQMVPFNYGPVVRSGSATKIEALMVREYLRQKQALPRPAEGIQTTGGYTDLFLTGVVGPVVHADVESLYPSIMIQGNISPHSDVLGIFHTLLKELTALRIEAKRNVKSASGGLERSRLDALQSSLKILINSFYGYLGYHRGLFNDHAQADVVTTSGQELLRRLMSLIQEAGGTVIEVDTDGVFFVPAGSDRSEEHDEELVRSLSAGMPEGIIVAMDGRYRRMLSYKRKNYALQEYDGVIRIKGSSLISRAMERFGRAYIQRCITLILQNDWSELHALYVDTHDRIAGHKWDVREFMRTEIIRETAAEYTLQVQSGRRNRTAAFELAIASGKKVKPGTRVNYYITGTEPALRSFENCKLAEEWNPVFPDENVAFYLRRLDEFSEKFKDFFHPNDFRSIFSLDDLFPFDPSGIEILTRKVLQGDDR